MESESASVEGFGVSVARIGEVLDRKQELSLEQAAPTRSFATPEQL